MKLLFLSNFSSYDFEYEENEEEEDGNVDIENKYYNAKQMKASDPEAAIEEFLGIPPLEQEKGDWGFKGLKQAIKLEFKLGLYDKVCFLSNLLDSADKRRLLSTTSNFSHMSRARLPATTPKSPSIISLITSRRPLATRARQNAWSSSIRTH